MNELTLVRDARYADQHDPIYASLDLVPDWFVYGHLSLKDDVQWKEKDRLNKFHLLIRDTARRFTGTRDLNALGWFLREEGNGQDKRFHFHFSITADHLTSTTPETVSKYLKKQWGKIARSECKVEPWDKSKTPMGIWYLTQTEPYPVAYSRYYHGDACRWKMSTLLYGRIKEKTLSSAEGLSGNR